MCHQKDSPFCVEKALHLRLEAFLNINLGGEYNWVLWVSPGVIIGVWISKAIGNFLAPKKQASAAI